MTSVPLETVILSKRFLRSEGPRRAARRVAFSATHNRAFGSLPYCFSLAAFPV